MILDIIRGHRTVFVCTYDIYKHCLISTFHITVTEVKVRTNEKVYKVFVFVFCVSKQRTLHNNSQSFSLIRIFSEKNLKDLKD